MSLLDELRHERTILATERETISARIEELLRAIRVLEQADRDEKQQRTTLESALSGGFRP